MLVICLLTWWLARLLRTQTALKDAKRPIHISLSLGRGLGEGAVIGQARRPKQSPGAGSGLGLAPRTRPGDPTNDSRSGDRPELARMFRLDRSGASQRWVGVNR